MRYALISLLSALWLVFPGSFALAEDELPEATYSDAEVAQLLAPIALYPDTLLSQILVASTYPLEVVQAARWSAKHPDLQGEEAVEAVQNKSWDPSVKALVAFSRILARMSDDLDWTEKLGDAFLEDEQRVLAQVQALRRKADEAGRLDDLRYARIERDRETKTIVIEPPATRVVYVPFYDPFYVYGGWYWHAYPPVVWLPPHHHHFPVGVYWSPGVHLSVGFFFTGFHWHSHRVIVWQHRHRPLRYREIRRARLGTDIHVWRHDPVHRRGVVYRSRRAAHRVTLSQRNQLDIRPNTRRQPAHGPNRSVVRPTTIHPRVHSEAGRPRADAVEQRLRQRHRLRAESRPESTHQMRDRPAHAEPPRSVIRPDRRNRNQRMEPRQAPAPARPSARPAPPKAVRTLPPPRSVERGNRTPVLETPARTRVHTPPRDGGDRRR